MRSKLDSIVQIASCVPHPNADRLSIATMTGNGWKVITARDDGPFVSFKIVSNKYLLGQKY